MIAHIIIAAALLTYLAPSSRAGEYKEIRHEGVAYRIYTAIPSELHLHWKDATGSQYRQFPALQRDLERQGTKLSMVTNAGIFDPGGIPSGLHIENGKTLKPINLKDAPGNFYLKPNGIFSITGDKPAIHESAEYQRANIAPRIALQSGPLLLRNDKIHPKFRKASVNRLHRSGIGVRDDGSVIIAITVFGSDNAVNLYGFATLFRHLGCKDALFLDGDISLMEVNPTGPLSPINNFGALLAVYDTTPPPKND